MIDRKAVAVERSASRGIGLFALTVFLSAFLLFQVQPLISKLILPWFGGSPAVWTAAMLFFQTVLFGGYVYSHLVTRHASPRAQACAHLALLAVASLLALLVLPQASARLSDAEDPLLNILLILATSVGLPYFCLATTAPLIQYWFTRTRPGQSAFRLYALSNAGSLIALLSFPYVFEPTLEIPQMGRFWTYLFGAFAASCAVVTFLAKDADEPLPIRVPAPETAITVSARARPTAAQRIGWVALPALGSLLFIATIDHISHDIAPEPLMFLICFACHGEVFRSRPTDARYLTDFYLCLSFGGRAVACSSHS